MTLELLQIYQKLEPVREKFKSWQKNKRKHLKADITILGNKTPRYLRKFNNTSINENNNILEKETSELNVPCLPLIMILLAFHISQPLTTKGHAESEKNIFKFYTKFLLSKCINLEFFLCNSCITCQLEKP